MVRLLRAVEPVSRLGVPSVLTARPSLLRIRGSTSTACGLGKAPIPVQTLLDRAASLTAYAEAYLAALGALDREAVAAQPSLVSLPRTLRSACRGAPTPTWDEG
jgi:hypothetical protein